MGRAEEVEPWRPSDSVPFPVKTKSLVQRITNKKKEKENQGMGPLIL